MIASPIIDTDLIVDSYHGLQAMLYLSQKVIEDSPSCYSTHWLTGQRRRNVVEFLSDRNSWTTVLNCRYQNIIIGLRGSNPFGPKRMDIGSHSFPLEPVDGHHVDPDSRCVWT